MKILLISDTHKMHGFVDIPLEGIDMILHAGDIGEDRTPWINANECLDFIEWFASLEHIPYKIFIPGNHDTAIEKGMLKGKIPNSIMMLNHELGVIGGLRIFGSPYTPTFGTGWAYNRSRTKLHEVWQTIPEGIDILITHGPPQGILDLSQESVSTGCKALRKRVIDLNPKIHLFGHIHEMGGCTMTVSECDTKFVNACVLDLQGRQTNNGIIIEL